MYSIRKKIPLSATGMQLIYIKLSTQLVVYHDNLDFFKLLVEYGWFDILKIKDYCIQSNTDKSSEIYVSRDISTLMLRISTYSALDCSLSWPVRPSHLSTGRKWCRLWRCLGRRKTWSRDVFRKTYYYQECSWDVGWSQKYDRNWGVAWNFQWKTPFLVRLHVGRCRQAWSLVETTTNRTRTRNWRVRKMRCIVILYYFDAMSI
jgi:hypothetical protein